MHVESGELSADALSKMATLPNAVVQSLIVNRPSLAGKN